MSFPIIGSKTVWADWDALGLGSWRMWFMAPYGSWVYAGFVKDNTPLFKKIDIGSSDVNYEISSWDFGLVSDTPEALFPYERHEGGPNGAMGCGVIRGTNPYLYLIGRSTSTASPDTILRRFDVPAGFEEVDSGCVPLDTVGGGGDPVNINHIAGIEVDSGTAFYIVSNNNDSNEFLLRRYAYPGAWTGADVDPSHEVELSPNYMENNTLARIRGISIASDGNILVFLNTGDTATDCRVLKFDKDDLSYLGRTTWAPNISTALWGYIVRASEVFLYFEGLDSNSLYSWKTAIYYDRATQIPDAARSNFIIDNNLTPYGSDEAVVLEYHARDAFNIVIPSVNTKFVIGGEDPDDPTTWTDRVGSIQDDLGDTFFDADDIPTSIEAIVATDVDGIATAYYKPPRSGSGTEIDDINVYCPSDS